jgi:hypothetical protein
MAIGDHYGRQPEEIAPFEETPRLQTGITAGFVATVVTAVAMLVAGTDLLSSTIPGMYGVENALVVGLVAHLVHGTIFGLVFAVVLSDPELVGITNSLVKTIAAGVVYGTVLAVVATGIIMPVWINAVGVVSAPTVPYITTGLLGMHLLYGLVLGALFPFVEQL